jgi:hypothetical protein
MSETPRTDAAVGKILEHDGGCSHMPFVPIDFARQLERELAEKKREIAASQLAVRLHIEKEGQLLSDLAALRAAVGEVLKIVRTMLTPGPSAIYDSRVVLIDDTLRALVPGGGGNAGGEA